MVVENILFIVPPNITYDHFVSPPANVSTTSLGSSARKFGPLVTDIPLGIISLSAYLKERLPLVTRAVDFNVQLLREPDFTHPDFKSYFRRHFEMPDYARFIPTVVALSALFTSSYHNVIDLAEVCCERFPGALILAGGNLCTTLYREFFAATDAIDAICFGEGERPFAELLEAVDRHALLARHSSWITRTKLTMPLSCGGGGAFRHDFIENLDEIPPLDYGILDLDGHRLSPLLSHHITSINGDALPIMTSRGCPFKCTFCASHRTHGRRMRYYSESRVIADIDRLIAQHGVKSFIIQDDHFMAGGERPYRIVAAIKERGGRIFFQNALALYALDRRFLQLLKEAGVDELTLPIESGSERVLKEVMHKPLKLEIVKRVVADCRDIGIFTDCNILVGMPGETKEDIDAGCAFLKEIHGDWFRVTVATPLPGSEMYDEAIANARFVDDPVNAHYKRAVLETPEWSAEYIQHASYAMNIELNFVHNSNMRLGNYRRALDCFENIVLRIKPNHALACFYAGRCLHCLGEPERAANYFTRAQEYASADTFWMPYIEQFDIPVFRDSMQVRQDENAP